MRWKQALSNRRNSMFFNRKVLKQQAKSLLKNHMKVPLCVGFTDMIFVYFVLAACMIFVFGMPKASSVKSTVIFVLCTIAVFAVILSVAFLLSIATFYYFSEFKKDQNAGYKVFLKGIMPKSIGAGFWYLLWFMLWSLAAVASMIPYGIWVTVYALMSQKAAAANVSPAIPSMAVAIISFILLIPYFVMYVYVTAKGVSYGMIFVVLGDETKTPV